MRSFYKGRSLSELCDLLGMSRQAYYARTRDLETDRFERVLLRSLVEEIRGDQPRVGGRKLFFLLQGPFLMHGLKIGRDNPSSTPHQPFINPHQPFINPSSTLHKPSSTLHKPSSTLHQPFINPHKPFINPHQPLINPPSTLAHYLSSVGMPRIRNPGTLCKQQDRGRWHNRWAC